jgi:hypothetical protein
MRRSAVDQLHARTVAQHRIRTGLMTLGTGVVQGAITLAVGGLDVLTAGFAVLVATIGTSSVVRGRRQLRMLAVGANRLPTAKLRR